MGAIIAWVALVVSILWILIGAWWLGRRLDETERSDSFSQTSHSAIKFEPFPGREFLSKPAHKKAVNYQVEKELAWFRATQTKQKRHEIAVLKLTRRGIKL